MLVDYNSYAQVRIKLWEKKFPGCTAEFVEIFGCDLPTHPQLAKWKLTWGGAPANTMDINYKCNPRVRSFTRNADLKAAVDATAGDMGIHPYYYDFIRLRTDNLEVQPAVSFYKQEHFIMFKLAW